MSLETPLGRHRAGVESGSGALATVRDAAYAVLRERGTDDDVREPGVDGGAVPGRAARGLPVRAGAPRGLRRRDGDRAGRSRGRSRRSSCIHTTAGLGNAVGRARDCARQPSSARRHRRPAGPPPSRPRAVPGRPVGRARRLVPGWVDQPVRAQDVPSAIDRAWHEAGTQPRPGARDRADGRLGGDAEQRTRSRRAPARWSEPTAADPAAVRTLAAELEAARSPALVVGAGADDPRPGAALARAGGTARCAGLAGVVRRPRRASRRTTRSSPGTCRPTGLRLREALSPHDVVLVVGAPCSASTRSRPAGCCSRARACCSSPPIQSEAHRSPADLALLAPPALGVRRSSPSSARAGTSPRPTARDRPARPARARRAAPRRCTFSTPSPSASARRRSSSRRRRPAGPTSTRGFRPCRTSASSAPRWAASASLFRARSACGWGRRTGRSSPWSETVRRCTRSRASGARPDTGSACSSSCCRTTATP